MRQPHRHPRHLRGFLCTLLLGALAGRALAIATIGPETITASAEHAVLARAGKAAARLSLQPSPLDARLRLFACDQPLQTRLLGDGRIHAHTTVGVSCTGSVRWTIYTSIGVQTRCTVLVTRHALARGSSPGPQDFVRETREIAGLASDYVTDPAALAGALLDRPIGAGEPLPVSALAAAPLIRRGQAVVLLARLGGIEVRMSGIALSDGGLDDRIRVQNSSSDRVVEGIVRSSSVVEAPL